LRALKQTAEDLERVSLEANSKDYSELSQASAGDVLGQG